jgi:flagellar basal-body rod modification protein FlgD
MVWISEFSLKGARTGKEIIMVDAINPYSVLSAAGSSSSDRKSITDDFDTFLTLLTTQLKNQDPSDPLDTNEFTQQLVQFTEVEQSVKLNENMETLMQLTAANMITGAVSYIGKSVTVSGDIASLKDGTATWSFSLPADSSDVTFTVYDNSGNEVYTRSGSGDSGTNEFTWSGEKTGGGLAPDGSYTLAVSAYDEDNNSLNVTTTSNAVIEGVNIVGQEPTLISGGREILLSSIKAINSA